MQPQKLYKNGNSVAVTIPKELMKELNLRDGSLVVVKKEGNELVVTPQKKTLAPGVDHKFTKMVDEFIEDHKDVLEELSKR
ncbi:AbrB/MazE/SpoVT family DNA-binding domain-containing protein [Candidatus Daviesbacteria bacterium]|nr:AbrB/MazE/SpoVT family DNA-binding domain-containing protein [Candidatus Daviesbacteria bacterium]